MRKNALVFCALVPLCMTMQANAQLGEQLSNGGFESGLNADSFEGFGLVGWANSDFTLPGSSPPACTSDYGVSETLPANGAYSMAFTSIGDCEGGAGDAVVILAGHVTVAVAAGATEATFSGSVNVDGLASDVTVRPQIVLLASDFSAVGSPGNDSIAGQGPGGSSGFLPFSMTVPVPPETDIVWLEIAFRGSAGGGAAGDSVFLDDISLILETPAEGEPEAEGEVPPVPACRPFHMGFTPWPYAATVQAVEDTWDKIQQHGDMVAIHLDNGIPWPEALAGTPYHANLEAELSSQQAHIDDGKTVYVGIATLNGTRSGLALYNGASGGLPLPAPWDTYAFNHPNVVTACTNYCLDIVARFQPDYLNIGIEATDLSSENPGLWSDYASLLSQVYANVKVAHPAVQIGASGGIRPPGSGAAATVANAWDDLDFVDYVGISAYPYTGTPWWGGDGNPGGLHPDWLSQATAYAGGRPIAVCETGWAAEDVVIPVYGWNIASSPAWQDGYVETLLRVSNDLDALFIVWWCLIDFDDLWSTFPSESKDIGRIWRDIGLYDESVVPRPGLTTWDAWLAATHATSGCSAEGEGEGIAPAHTADQDADGLISLSELLRVIQFYNFESHHCEALSEEGYAPGPGETACTPHDSDYAPVDWRIGISELLRLIQFFNGGGYHACAEGEDGFCPASAQ